MTCESDQLTSPGLDIGGGTPAPAGASAAAAAPAASATPSWVSSLSNGVDRNGHDGRQRQRRRHRSRA